MDRWYIVADCKTPECKGLMVIKDFGETRPPSFDIKWTPAEFPCAACQQSHLYYLADLKVRSYPPLRPPTGPTH